VEPRRQPTHVAPGPRPPSGSESLDALTARPRPETVNPMVPAALADQFRFGTNYATTAIMSELRKRIPEYARPLEGRFGWALTEGVEHAVDHFIRRITDPSRPRDEEKELFRWLGKLHAGEPEGVGPLQAAYRLGARVAWRLLADYGRARDLPATTMSFLADALFGYVDEISALSAEGYAVAQARAAGVADERRRRLLRAIVTPRGAAPETLARLAGRAGWPLPEYVMVVVLERHGAEQTPLAFGDTVLADLDADEPCLVVAEANVGPVADELATAHGWRAATGPRARPARAATALRWARRALELVDTGVLPDAPLTWCEEHLTPLILTTDDLVDDLIRRCLAPLTTLTDKQRTRLSDTLLARLETSGSAPEIAARLHVHPQTVRYRLRQLDALFGDRLRNPADRFDLELALRAARLRMSTAP
jgi:PucR-like helix-turn-helix protein